MGGRVGSAVESSPKTAPLPIPGDLPEDIAVISGHVPLSRAVIGAVAHQHRYHWWYARPPAVGGDFFERDLNRLTGVGSVARRRSRKPAMLRISGAHAVDAGQHLGHVGLGAAITIEAALGVGEVDRHVSVDDRYRGPGRSSAGPRRHSTWGRHQHQLRRCPGWRRRRRVGASAACSPAAVRRHSHQPDRPDAPLGGASASLASTSRATSVSALYHSMNTWPATSCGRGPRPSSGDGSGRWRSPAAPAPVVPVVGQRGQHRDDRQRSPATVARSTDAKAGLEGLVRSVPG